MTKKYVIVTYSVSWVDFEMNKRSYKMLNICTNEKIRKALVNALTSFGPI